MKIVEASEPSNKPAAIELKGAALIWYRVESWCRRNISRRLPRLVWFGDEVDVCVTFSEDPINEVDPMVGLFSGGMAEIESQLRRMGIKFDRGQGCSGRDWEWDWSLSGPISVRFRGRAKKPELRKAEDCSALKIVS